jgi:hypothetical protein
VALEILGVGAEAAGWVVGAGEAELELAAGFEADVRRGVRGTGCSAYSLDRYGGAGRGVGDEKLLLDGDPGGPPAAPGEQAGHEGA